MQGQTWTNAWNITYDTTGLGSLPTTDAALAADFTADEITAMDADFNSEVDLVEFLVFNSYKAHWNLMLGNDSAVDTLNATTLTNYTYRNFLDYSAWNYTADMFTAMDSDADGALSYSEYVQWLPVQFEFANEILASPAPESYELSTAVANQSEVVFFGQTEREFGDMNFDGFVDFGEYVLAVTQYAPFEALGFDVSTDNFPSFSSDQMALLDYNQDGIVSDDEWFAYQIAARVWTQTTNLTEAEAWSMPADFDELSFHYFDQNLDGEVTFDEYCLASVDSLNFDSYLIADNTTFPVEALGWTTIENNWIDLNSDGEVEWTEWQAAFVDQHQFYLASEGADTMTDAQALAANFTQADVNLMDSNGDGVITLQEYAGFVTSDREWQIASDGQDFITYEDAMALGKTEYEWEWLNSNFDEVITIDEWTAGKVSENAFLTVKANDTADCFDVSLLAAYVGNDTYNDWYDENLDGEVCWREWMNFDMDQAYWSYLDVDGDDYVNATELNATDIAPELILQWLDTNADSLVEWTEYVPGMIDMNQFDALAQLNRSADDSVIDQQEMNQSPSFREWFFLNQNDDEFITIEEWIESRFWYNGFLALSDYDAATQSAGPASFGAWYTEETNLNYTDEVNAVADANGDGAISLEEGKIFYGWINMWFNVANETSNALSQEAAFNASFSEEEFYWMDSNFDGEVTYEEYLQAGTEINVWYYALVNGTFQLAPVEILDQASGEEWLALVNPSGSGFVDFDDYTQVMTGLNEFYFVAPNGTVNETLFREQPFFDSYNLEVMHNTNPSAEGIDFTMFWQSVALEDAFFARWDLLPEGEDLVTDKNYETIGMSQQEFEFCDINDDGVCEIDEAMDVLASYTLFRYYANGADFIVDSELTADYSEEEKSAYDINGDSQVNLTEWYEVEHFMESFNNVSHNGENFTSEDAAMSLLTLVDWYFLDADLDDLATRDDWVRFRVAINQYF